MRVLVYLCTRHTNPFLVVTQTVRHGIWTKKRCAPSTVCVGWLDYAHSTCMGKSSNSPRFSRRAEPKYQQIEIGDTKAVKSAVLNTVPYRTIRQTEFLYPWLVSLVSST